MNSNNNNNKYEQTLLDNDLKPEVLLQARKYLRDNIITQRDFNKWLWDIMGIELRHRVVIMDWAQQDLEGFIQVE